MGSITGDDNKTNGTSQPEAKKVKFSPAPAITGRDIVLRYLKGEMTAAISYQKICTALQTISDWPSEVSRAQIIEQFLSMADLLDSRCDSLVHNLLKVRWDAIPVRIMPDFKRFLADIGVRQIAYTELVYTTLISKLAPEMLVEEKEVDGKMKSTWKMKYTEEVQQEYYIMAHTIISHILKCFPMSSKLLLKVIQQGYPHYMQHPSKTEAFIRNIILLQQYAPMVRKEIWKTIFHRLINDDAHVSRGRTDTLFAIENEKAEEVTSSEATEATSHEDLLVRQLDASCVDVMTYISKCFDPEATLESAGWIVSEVISMEELFAILKEMMETAMLSASHVRSISCVFLHLCSLKEEFATKTLESLWKWIIRIPLAPSDTKKSHGASAYLASFLAKASYVDTNTTFMYLEKMMSWLTRYADQFGSGTKNVQSGTARHSVFYSLCQAFFTVFSYRYKEITKKSKFAEVRHWGIGKVVHSPLEPLKFVLRRVALCFSAITRSLQLVYCSHLIPLENEREMPFEHMFPFEGPYLPRSTPWLTPLIRTFTPLPEDVSQLTSVLRLKMEEPKKEKSDDTSFVDHGMDFLDVDDAFFHDTVRSRTNSFMITSLY